MLVKPVNLCGVAVHTRNNQIGQDYNWYVKTGKLQLFDKMDEIFRLALRDVSGEMPKFAIITHGQHIGFLISDLPCERLDHSKRVIHNTLYLEFSAKNYKTVLNAAAMLLLTSQPAYNLHETHFTEYAEKLLQATQKPAISLETIKLPIIAQQPNFKLPRIKPEKVALFSNSINRNRCAHYLLHHYRRRNHHFIFVSTGRVSLEKCQQIAEKYDAGILLSLSSEVQPEVNLKVTNFSKFKEIYSIILGNKK
ncbi:MAG: hypothetical protein KAH84_05280 [Thiomargarita sp.]|nr:hypothetical protein [Thiomargarita sp.]